MLGSPQMDKWKSETLPLVPRESNLWVVDMQTDLLNAVVLNAAAELPMAK